MTIARAWIGQVTGTIEHTATGMQLRCDADDQLFPLGISGANIQPPLPETRQIWSVVPKTNSDGKLTGLKTWQYDDLIAMQAEINFPCETWELTGTIAQVSTKSQFILLNVTACVPQPKQISITLSTIAASEFAVGQTWRIIAHRNQDRLQPIAATCLQPGTKILTRSQLVGETSDNQIASQAAGDSRLIEQAQAALVTLTRITNWKLGTGTTRFDSAWQVTVWEFNAEREGARARVKVSESDHRSAVYQFPNPPLKEWAPKLEERLSVIPLGAARDIGASCFRVLIGPYEVILDAGTRPKGHNPLPAFEQIENPDLLIISHAHQDHIGAVPVFHRQFSGTPMICTPGTRELAQVMLRDGLNVQQKNEDVEPLFDEHELERSLFRLQTYDFSQDFEPLPGLTVRLIPAGHIVGAACIYLQYGDRSLLYTGDYNLASSRTTDGLSLADLPNAEILITEGTYGDIAHPSRKQQERELIESVIEVVKQGGNVLIPAFALGRAQEILLAFRQHPEFRQLGIPIYVDGLVRAVTDCFREHLTLLPVSLQRFATTQEPFFSPTAPEIIPIKHTVDRPLAMARPSVIIASSGMLNGGASVYYAQTLLERENAALFISGYTDEESPGRKIQSLSTGSVCTIAGKEFTVRAQVKRFSLSAHADKIAICQVSVSAPMPIRLRFAK